MITKTRKPILIIYDNGEVEQVEAATVGMLLQVAVELRRFVEAVRISPKKDGDNVNDL